MSENKTQNNKESNGLADFLKDARVLGSLVFLGAGAMIWVYNIALNPITSIQHDIDLIQKSIEVIETNHEAHIEQAMEDIKENNTKIKELRQDFNKTNENVIRLLTIYENQ